MRVGLRRLRSALDLFADEIPAYADLDEELRWIASELGAARDWEVLAGSTLEHAGANGNAEEILPVWQACEQIAVNNRQRAAAAVESVRYTRLVLQLALWLNRKGWQDGMSDKQREGIGRPAGQFAAEVVRRRHGKLIKRGKRLADLDDHRRHRARVAAKKVRYATEFFASLCARRAVRHYVDALTELQDDLGWRNDAVVADQLLKLLSRTSPKVTSGAAFVRGYLASGVAAAHQTLKKRWKRFRRLSPPWLQGKRSAFRLVKVGRFRRQRLAQPSVARCCDFLLLVALSVSRSAAFAVTNNAASWSRSTASTASKAFFSSFCPGFVALPPSEMASASFFNRFTSFAANRLSSDLFWTNSLICIVNATNACSVVSFEALASSDSDFLLIKILQGVFTLGEQRRRESVKLRIGIPKRTTLANSSDHRPRLVSAPSLDESMKVKITNRARPGIYLASRWGQTR
jgi:CHAD domain-containing protein